MRIYFLIALYVSSISLDVKSEVIRESNYCSPINQVTQLKQLQFAKNRLAFRNRGGLINGGVCWWHSRFLRNANVLTYFSPKKKIPSFNYIFKRRMGQKNKSLRVKVPAPGSINDILLKIKKGKEVVEITGFSNLREFSAYFRDEIQSLLENWQIEDGFIKQQWVVGLLGSSSINPEQLRQEMNKTYQRVKNNEIVYQKLQIKGIVAHAWLIVSMDKVKNGHKIKVIDSNYSEVQTYYYQEGDSHLYHPYYGNFVPYTEKIQEWKKIKQVKQTHCTSVELKLSNKGHK